MNAVRYYLALTLTILLPPALLFWLIIHPFVGFWRKVGPGWAYVAVTVVVGSGSVGLFLVRRTLLAVDWGTNWLLVSAGVVCVVVSIAMLRLVHRHLPVKARLGWPELAPHRHKFPLLREGPYARVRHPRYVQMMLAFIGYALVANYPALYVAVVAWVPGFWLIAVAEERELRNRFGTAYDEYCLKVPRFFPRLGHRR